LSLRADLRVDSANETFYKVFKTSPEKTEGQLIFTLGNGQWNIPRLRQFIESVISNNSFFTDFEVTHDFPVIGRRTILLGGRCLISNAGKAERILIAFNDITERKQAEDALLRSKEQLEHANASLESRVQERTFSLTEANDRLQELSNRLIMAQEDERRRIARELHDQIGQGLTAALLLTKTTKSPNPLPELQSVLRELTEDVRRLSTELHPHVLTDLGLKAALDWHVKTFYKRTKILVKLNYREIPKEALTPETQITIFRITQEALTNIGRHSGSTMATVNLHFEHQQIHLEIADLGRGFDANAPVPADSNGLRGMKERVTLLNGVFKIDSSPGQGTRISISLPGRKL
jgi:signal transduction histidine kinase